MMKGEAHDPSASSVPRVMIVDERAEMLELMSIYIKNMGLFPLTAQTKQEAMSKANDGELSLLIIEVLLRGDNGIHVAKSIRRKINQETMPVIVMCGAFAAADLAGMCQSLSNSQHITKPFSSSQLTARVREAIPAAFA